MLGCLCIRKFERELGFFWRVILARGRGVRLGRFLSWLGLDRFWLGWLGLDRFGLGLAWLGLDRFWLGLAWLGLDRFWLGLGWLGPFLVGLAWIVFGPDKGLAKKKLNKFLRLRRA